MKRRIPALGRFALLLAVPLLWAAAGCSSDGGGTTPPDDDDDDDGAITTAGLITVDGVRRAYVVHIPEGADGTRAPLLIAYHGAFSAADVFRFNTGLDIMADSLGMVIAFPQARGGNWAEDCGCIAADSAMINDTLFTSLLIDTMVVNWGVDAGQIGVIGFSQGGMFAERLACQMAGLVDQVALVAATISEPLAARCDPRAPVDMLMVIGNLDGEFPWEGRDAGLKSTLGAIETMDFWGSLNGCDDEPMSDDDSDLIVREWTNCDAGGGSRLVGIRGGTHAFRPGNFPTLAELRDHFRR